MDKCSKHLFAHNAARYKSSQIFAMKDQVSNTVQTTQLGISKAIDRFWMQTFKKRKISNTHKNNLLSWVNRTLDNDEHDELNKDPDIHLLMRVLDDKYEMPEELYDLSETHKISVMKLNKSPGRDGIPLDFYVYFSKFNDNRSL